MKDLVSQGLKAPSFQKWLERGQTSGVFQRPEIDFMNLLRLGSPKPPPPDCPDRQLLGSLDDCVRLVVDRRSGWKGIQ